MAGNNAIFILLLFGMTVAVLRDIESCKVPNYVTFPLMLAGLAWHGGMDGLSGLGFSAAGLSLGIAVFIIPYILGGMGAGDVKLLGAAGAILGAKGVVVTAVLSILIGFLYAIVLLLAHPKYLLSMLQRFWATVKTLLFTGQLIVLPRDGDQKQLKLKYALPIALGSLAVVYLKLSESNPVQYILGFQFSL